LQGFKAIQAYLASHSKCVLRTLKNTLITTYGNDDAKANTEFETAGNPRNGRQSQTCMRTCAGWKIVAAHVSWCAAA
jgi:hypothetical protein